MIATLILPSIKNSTENNVSIYNFVPGIGIKNGKIYHLISFCLGYGLEWLLVMDDGKNSLDIKKELSENLFNNEIESIDKKVHILKGINGIENMFTCNDLLLIDDKLKCDEKDDKVKKIGNGRKILFAKTFLQYVEEEKIQVKDLDNETIEKWKEIFSWINESFDR